MLDKGDEGDRARSEVAMRKVGLLEGVRYLYGIMRYIDGERSCMDYLMLTSKQRSRANRTFVMSVRVG